MRVCLATNQAVTILRGGPKTQILQSKVELENLGVRVSLFNSWKEFHRTSFDLVHFFGANIGTYHLAREIHKLGVPIVISPIFYTRHKSEYVRRVVRTGNLLKRISRGIWTDYGMMAEMCSWATIVAVNTVAEAALFIDGMGVPEDKVRIVPNGVESRFEEAKPTPFRKAYGAEKFILSVGHIGPERKNVVRLVRALEEINHPAFIIGRIEDTPAGRQCVDLAKKNPRITILESIDHDSDLLASAFAACDVFVLPSQFETPGIAALEAGLAGAKIVITPHGGTKEYFGEFAEYVDPYSVKSIREGIQIALIKDKDKRLRDRIRKEYLWSHVAEQLRSVYAIVVDHKENRAPKRNS
jgi:glycosyltransferase involved in cell wall biosynthesis